MHVQNDIQATDERFPRLVQNAGMRAMSAKSAFSIRGAWEAYETVLALAEAVDLLATQVARLTPVVHAGRVGVDTASIVDLLRYPGLNRSRQQLVREIVTRMLVTGTAYVVLVGRHDRHPLSIDVIDSQRVEMLPGYDGWPAGYRVGGHAGYVFKRIGLTRLNMGFVSAGVGELVPIYELPGDVNGIGLPRLRAIWSLISTASIDTSDDALVRAVRRRFEIPMTYAAGPDPGLQAELLRNAVLPLFATVHDALARALSERWNDDIQVRAGQPESA